MSQTQKILDSMHDADESDDLAGRLGVTNLSVTRTLQHMVREGLVEVTGRERVRVGGSPRRPHYTTRVRFQATPEGFARMSAAGRGLSTSTGSAPAS